MIKRAATFTAIAVAASWGIFFLAAMILPPETATVSYTLFMLGPFISALITARIFDRGQTVSMLGLAAGLNWWWLVALIGPTLLATIAMVVTGFFPGVSYVSTAEGVAALAAAQGTEIPPEQATGIPPIWALIVLAATLGGAFNMLFAMGEESGWRGYLWSVLRPLGFWPASYIIGVIWGLWHTPLIVLGHNYGTEYSGHPWLGILMMTLFTLGLSPLLGLMRDKAKSAWPAALFHGSLNAVAGLFILVQAGASPLIAGLPGLTGVITLAVASLGVFVYRRRYP